jgi:hypothetical protein
VYTVDKLKLLGVFLPIITQYPSSSREETDDLFQLNNLRRVFCVRVVLGFELRAYTLSHTTSPFYVMGFFQNRVSQTIFQGWLQTTILLISAS